MTGPRQQLGAAGEAAVEAYYVAKGFTVLDRNWRDGRRGEIDLVLGCANLVVACEVKTRSGTAFGDGVEAITRIKQVRMRQVATAWAMGHRDERGWVDLRIDVAVVSWPRGGDPAINIIEGAC